MSHLSSSLYKAIGLARIAKLIPTAEVVYAASEIFADVDLAIGIGDFIDAFHLRID